MMGYIVMSIMTVLLMSITMIVTPIVGRKSSQFGVTIPMELQDVDELNKIKKKFIAFNVVQLFVLLVPHVYMFVYRDTLDLSQVMSVYMILEMLVYTVVSFLLFLTSRRDVLELKSTFLASNGETFGDKIVVDTSFRQDKLIVPNWLFLMTNGLIIFLVIAWTGFYYHDFPETIVTNFDIHMNPTREVVKTWQTVSALPVIQLMMLLTLFISNQSFFRAKQQLSSNQKTVYKKNNQRFRYWSSVSLFIISIMTQILLAFTQVGSMLGYVNGLLFLAIMITYLIVTLGLSFLVSFKYGQSGERVLKNAVYDTFDDDKNWKLGIFYINKEDPTVWVEKKYGVGTTLNFARWQSWAFFLFILIGPIAVAMFLL